MRVHLYSDLHLEISRWNVPDRVASGEMAELVLLAGDIDVKRRAIRWAAQSFRQKVVLVGGNHESYGDSLYAGISENRKIAKNVSKERAQPVYFLERETCVLQALDGTQVRVVGATLWTDFSLFGKEEAHREMARASSEMNDYQRIKVRSVLTKEIELLTPQEVARFHLLARIFITDELRREFDGITIVMTHHAPSRRSLENDLRSGRLSASYASSLDHVIEEFGPDLWVHGHIHSSNDYRIGRTRVVSNPRGYVPYEPNPRFDSEFVIDL